MKIIEIRLDTAKTINLGDFNSIRVQAGVTAELADGDDIAMVKADLQNELRILLDDTYRAQKRRHE